jgi:hypothetical protein
VSNEHTTHAELYGIEFIKVLYHLIHTARIHNDNNQLIRESLSKFKGILDERTREEDLKLQLWRGRFHIGGEKLPYKRDSFTIINEMMKYFSRSWKMLFISVIRF